VSEHDKAPTVADPRDLEAARRIYAEGSEDRIEIDDGALTSDAGDGSGCWVSAWVWVSKEDRRPDDCEVRP